MLVKLMPTEIADRWELIKKAIIESKALAKTVDQREQLNNILYMAIADVIDVWSIWSDDQTEFVGLMITSITVDSMTLEKNIHTFALWAAEGRMPLKIYKSGVEQLKRLGKAKGCKAITGFGTQEQARIAAVVCGGSTDIYMIRIPIEEAANVQNSEEPRRQTRRERVR